MTLKIMIEINKNKLCLLGEIKGIKNKRSFYSLQKLFKTWRLPKKMWFELVGMSYKSLTYMPIWNQSYEC